jgi:HEAT repeat protein/energy-coupling factor transporter ATP-binding protein EcfA2
MNSAIQGYLEELRNYASRVSVPGLDVASEPIPMGHVFIEPLVQSTKSQATGAATEGRRGGWEKDGAKESDGPPRQSRIARPEPANAALARQQRVVILGEPGQGKSTLLRQYAALLAAKSSGGRLPLLVELGLSRGKTEQVDKLFRWLRDRLPECLKQALDEQMWAYFCQALESGGVCVLLDGLDELAPEAQRQVRDLAGALRGNQVVVSSRPHVYHLAPLNAFAIYQLQDLNANQTQILARNVCDALASQYGVNAAAANGKVLQVAHGQAAMMARNPLFLSFMCLTAVRRLAENNLDDFPSRPTPLIAECVEALVEWHRTHKAQSVWPKTLLASHVTGILAPLALESFRGGTGVIKQQFLVEYGRHDRREQEAFFKHLVDARFVERRGKDYAFPLETFREYFAAHAVAANRDPYAVVKPYLHRPEWQRVILFTAGNFDRVRASRLDLMLPACSSLFAKAISPLLRIAASLAGLTTRTKPIKDLADEAIKEYGPTIASSLEKWQASSRRSVEFFVTAILRHRCSYESLLGRDLRLAVRCLGSAIASPEGLARGLVDDLVIKTPRWDGVDSALRDGAACKQVWRRLLELTRHEAPGIREVAARALGGAASEREVWQRLLELRHHDAFRALAEVASEPEVRDRLLELTGDQNGLVVGAVVPALASAASDPKIQARLLELTRDRNSWTRTSAVEALSMVFSQPKVKGRLLELAGQDFPVSEAEEAERKRLRGRLVRGGDPRAAAVRTLAQAAWEPRVRAELLTLATDNNPNVREAVAEAFAFPGAGPRVVEVLLGLTRDDFASVRMAAVQALAAAVSTREVWQQLLTLRYDEDDYVRRAAAQGVANVASEAEVRQQLYQLAREDDESVRMFVAQALGGAASEPDVWPYLFDLARDEFLGVRSAAMSALARAAGKHEVRAWLLKLTWDQEEFVRNNAACALVGAAPDPDVRKRLLELTRDKDPYVGVAAAKVLRSWRRPLPRAALRRVATMVRKLPTSGWLETLESLLTI